MNRIFIFLVCLVHLYSLSDAQTAFQKTYSVTASPNPMGSNMATYVQSVVHNSTDSGIFVLGGYMRRSCAIETDNTGNVRWAKYYRNTLDTSQNIYLISGQQTLEGGYIYGGENDYKDINTNQEELLIVKTDLVGQTIWSKCIRKAVGDNYLQLSSIKQTSDKGYIVLGSIDEVSSPNTRVFLLKLDSTGNIQWNYKYRTSNTNMHGYSVVDKGNGYFVNSTISSMIDSTVLFVTDTLGNLMWSKAYPYGNTVDEYTDAVMTRDRSFVLGGGFATTSSIYRSTILKVDSTGNMIWKKAYGLVNESWTNDMEGHVIKETKTGKLVVSGQHQNDVYLLETDASGNLLWARKYADGPRPGNINVTANNDILISGSDGQTNGSFYLARTDSNGVVGCVDSLMNCFTLMNPVNSSDSVLRMEAFTSIDSLVSFSLPIIGFDYIPQILDLCSPSSVNDITTEKLSCEIYPNPTLGKFTIITQGQGRNQLNINLYDALGREVLRDVMSDGEISLDLSGHSIGLYFVQIIDKNNTISLKILLQ